MNRHLQLNWWKYAAVAFAAIALWCGIFSSLSSPAQNEQLSILYMGDALDADGLQAYLQAAMPSITQQTIRKVRVTATVPDGMNSKSLLMTYCASYDLIIIQQSHLAPNVGQTIFARLTEDMLSCFPDAKTYTEPVEGGTLPFGLVLYDGSHQNNFSAFCAGAECCYLFFSPYSVNFDGLNEYGQAGNDAGIATVQLFLEHSP